jgi:hypothetical protein
MIPTKDVANCTPLEAEHSPTEQCLRRAKLWLNSHSLHMTARMDSAAMPGLWRGSGSDRARERTRDLDEG